MHIDAHEVRAGWLFEERAQKVSGELYAGREVEVLRALQLLMTEGIVRQASFEHARRSDEGMSGGYACVRE